MIKTLKDWFWQTETTVETILSAWVKTVKELEDHIEAKVAEELKHNILIDAYKEAATFANAEANKARDVAAKIKALFN